MAVGSVRLPDAVELCTGEISTAEPEDAAKNLPEAHVMIAGLSRSGKSTALNNIFGLQLKAMRSPTAVTRKVSISEVVYEISLTNSEKKSLHLKIVDTPGLKDINIDEKVVLYEMTKFRIRKDFILLLTLSVSSNSTITLDYSTILKNLTEIFGKEIWKRCIFLLTSSDTQCDQYSSEPEEADYELFLRKHCDELQKHLRKCKVMREVKLFFEYETEQKFRTKILDGIVAIPVGKSSKFPTTCLLPNQPWAHQYDWTELSILEIAKLAPAGNNSMRPIFITLRHVWFITIQNFAIGSATGATLGVIIGSALGLPAGIGIAATKAVVGAGAAGSIGGIIGVIGGAISGTIEVTSLISDILQNSYEEEEDQ